MKKLLYILGIMMFCSALTQPFTAAGQEDGEQFSGSEADVPMSSANIFSKLTDKMGLKPDLDWGDSFGYNEKDEGKVGKDMYMVIYQKINVAPAKKSIKNISGKYGLNEGDMWLVLTGDYTPIADRKPGLSQEELLLKVSEMRNEYNQMKDLYQTEADIKAAVEPSEMFANGDLSDSGFDLINDLDLIDEILFLKTSPIDIGKSYTKAGGEGASAYGQQPVTTGEITGPAGIKTPPEGTVSGGGGTDSVSESGSGAPTVDAQTSGGQKTMSGETEIFNPNVCFVDNKYNDALDKFADNSLTNANLKDLGGEMPETVAYSAPGTGLGTDGTDKYDPTGGAVTETLPSITTPTLPPVQSAPADNWLKDRYCLEFFCLDLNFVMAPAKSSFANSDNCIACHVEKINDVLKEVINHSLVPTKAPGNLGESAECKRAMGTAFESLSMNVYAIGMPVKTPINDDLMFGTSIDDEWENYCNKVAFFPFDMCGEDEKKDEDAPYEEPVSLTERAANQAIVQMPEGATQAELSKRINEQVAGYEAQQAKELEALKKEQVSDENALLYQPLKYELDRMNYLFKNIQNILHSLHEEVAEMPGRQACYDLKNKNECE